MSMFVYKGEGGVKNGPKSVYVVYGSPLRRISVSCAISRKFMTNPQLKKINSLIIIDIVVEAKDFVKLHNFVTNFFFRDSTRISKQLVPDRILP